MRLLDLFCGAGGATRGYQMAGFYVIGVDVDPQPRYVGDEFYQMDAFDFVREYRGDFDAIHASPPCQGYGNTQRIQGNEYPMLIEDVRKLLQATDKSYVIENVKGAPLIDPTMLVGSMFGLRTMRPRLFECSFDVPFILAPPPNAKNAKMGRQPQPGEYVHVVGHMSNVDYCRRAMRIDWMNRGELAEAIPPAYTKWIGQHLIEAIGNKAKTGRI